MTSRRIIAAVFLASVHALPGQSVAVEPADDPVLEAIQKFKSREDADANEVTVVLEPPDDPDAPADPKEEAAPAPDAEASEGSDQGGDPKGSAEEPAASAATEDELLPPTPSEPRRGLAVTVEKLQQGDGQIDPSQVKLLAPFPAKPLSAAPEGWKLETSDQIPPFSREVELAPGKTITLTIRPHLLVPEADGVTSFSVAEPGFDPALGYCQDATVGAILSTSIRQLEEDSKALGSAIDDLQQILVSLPKPEAAAEEKPAAVGNPKPATQRKR